MTRKRLEYRDDTGPEPNTGQRGLHRQEDQQPDVQNLLPGQGEACHADQDIRHQQGSCSGQARHHFRRPLKHPQVQQLLGSLLNSDLGTYFLNTMEDICNVCGQVDRYRAKVEEWSQH